MCPTLQLAQPNGVAFNDQDNILVADNAKHCIQMLSAEGVFVKQLVTRFDGLWHPMALSAYKSGNEVTKNRW